ncbi:MAG: SDR family NAD(P)-dependent oxidoreductase [Phycisphaeraceae bacterium]|nr:MAG: SDR family NAD(P)-dependent oxidoreductase [Phycisphaeraceae bacterium]
MNGDFTDRHVVVTGGAGALGGAVVELLLETGAMCHVPCFDRAEYDGFPFTSHDRVRAVAGVDLAKEEACESFFAEPPDLWASIHIAGGFAMAPIAETSLANWRRMMDMNATSCFLSCREAVRKMRASDTGEGTGGRIVNVAARPALAPAGGMIAYTTSKAAVASITQCLAEELKSEGIWVNAVVPSIMDTPANREAMPDADHASWASVEDVARTIVFLASPDNRVSSGGLVPVYGRS